MKHPLKTALLLGALMGVGVNAWASVGHNGQKTGRQAARPSQSRQNVAPVAGKKTLAAKPAVGKRAASKAPSKTARNDKALPARSKQLVRSPTARASRSSRQHAGHRSGPSRALRRRRWSSTRPAGRR